MGARNHCLGPRQIARFEQAASLLPGVDPVEVYRFYIRHTQTGRKTVPLADAARSYLQMLVETGRAVAYVSHARKALEDFAEELGSHDVADYDAEAIRGHLYGLNYSPVTIRHRRGHLLCAFAWWTEQGWIDENPVEKVKRPNVVSGEPGILPVADMERLFRANEKVDPGICGILALGAFAGMRTSAIGRLDFEELDFGQRGILTPACKTKKRRRQWIEGLPENLWKWLERTPPEIFALDGRQLLHRRAEAFKRAGLLIEADDIAYENRKREARGEPLVTWQPTHPPKNCLRHSFATYHVALHRDPGKTALILSHRNQQVLYQHYLGIATSAEAEKYFRILPRK